MILLLLPAAVEAVKQETEKKMRLFSSDGKAERSYAPREHILSAGLTGKSVASMNRAELEKLVEIVALQVRKELGT